ncbi:NADH-quinone oxidoreductase subunit J [Neoehrlichia mikurensis]|uniref:NADH-quinone oxidoreductase subunit J n=1 Tax=Neoehrlichia mikurensis TaxID=89586 RepID=A0A9Q9F471_9RICK|nr:NADH-quinone oxidoreductase subunit J [Neoehrlichia mikurensis]QXK92348.1 NADH-quinone oxidoreductase subunit J [Neoehrlichia mikurensis]QXK93193.1 NADH-quinone oxidoreductase subunit J [Neoehrlichia mikurensis]QXK94042.1 NADH-quinone oxidoreductase subunit J [Neoehrlichia mikurensis]UTO55969.1 NADH-quinone oxidoreductase subunit J [Neoehrlichia mikurensis]UTO56885.1 NADH-quinone oxidoreductase subunit J [Neoehrlichia mikurensis]
MCFLFYLFSFFLVVSAITVIIASNPVYSVLSLILTFFISSTLFILLGAEFIAMLIIIVYVGAVAVLFLFVVMMIDIDYSRIKQGFTKYFIISLMCGVVFFVDVVLVIQNSHMRSDMVKNQNNMENVFMIGNVIYTDYMYAFHLSGILLLVSIVSALVLALYHQDDALKQDVHKQVSRDSSVKLADPKFLQGVTDEDFD